MSSFWDEFKDLFKTDKQIAEERQQEIKDALKKEESVAQEIQQLKQQYEYEKKQQDAEPDWDKLFPTVTFDEIEYSPRTDEELYQEAKTKTDLKKQTEKDDLFEEYKQSVKSLGEQKEQSKASVEDSFKQLEKLYADLRRDTEYDAIKRGVTNSSHTKNQLEGIDGSKAQATKDVQSTYKSTLADIDAKLAQLEIDKEKALGELDIKYAIELSEQIEELENERAKEIEQNKEFNNDVREKNAKAKATREKNILDYKKNLQRLKQERDKAQQEYEDKYGYVGKKQDNYAQRYELAFDFYTSLSPDIALDALRASPNMKYYLGKYYLKLATALDNISPEDKVYY